MKMPHKDLLSSSDCVLMVVDIQDAFQGHIPDLEQVIARSSIMIQAARLLEIPIIVTEQYPKGLGRTVESLRNILGECPYYDKLSFSCLGDEKIKAALSAFQRSQLLMVGIETHVCIAQTAFDALALGLKTYLAADAISSRQSTDAHTAIERLRNAGVIITTTEAAILEMTNSSQHPRFREISKLIK